MKIHVVARRAVAAVVLSAAAAAMGSTAIANAAPMPLDKPGPVSFCSVFGGPIPVIGRLPYCQKKVPEKMSIPGGPVTVPIER